MKKIISYSLLLISLLLLFRWLFERNVNASLQQQEFALKNALSNYEAFLEQKKILAINNFLYSNIDWYTISVRDLMGAVYSTKEVFEQDEPLLIAYFDSRMCSVCLETEWQNFLSIAERIKGKVYLLTKGYPSGYFRQKDEFANLQEQIFILEEDLSIPKDSPIYLIKTYQGTYAFQADKLTNDTYLLINEILSLMDFY